ncbi:PREDICTED: uncharacterized protein LOC109243375 [Nicotiana attenuata]|uniref:uncharacterized protein LOC109243375 n=1 Tax=Nicotiana attenuata TaxID=49451 RepID=UPI0009056C68|nr:PREDICTED: uncharacterized protein LOC109243375 [Nicotiana attenuata]
MGIVESVPNFRGWVEKLLKLAPMEGRSWKTLSNRYGWQVKTHGFAIRGVTPEDILASRDQDIFLGSVDQDIASRSEERKSAEEDDSEGEDEGSLISRPRARRRIISEDEADVSPNLPLSEPVITPVIIPDDDVSPPPDTHESINEPFISGFSSGLLG